MEQELVTVVVPIYNVEKYLDRCIQSIVNQTYRNLEILLIDDGSQDNCPAMCDEWAKRDNRIRVIHKENQGLGMARNTGIEYATGEYICYFDSDDYVDTQTIELAYGEIKKNNADMAIFGHYIVYPDGDKVGFCKGMTKTVYSGAEITEILLPWMIHPDLRKEPKSQFPFSAWSGLLRRAVLEENCIRFQSEREIVSEDTLYLLELYCKVQTVVLIPKELYYYCVNPVSLTKTYKEERQEKNNAFLHTAREMIESLGLSNEVWIRINMLYHGFSMEAMKHVLRLSAPFREKRRILCSILSDDVLHKSLTRETFVRNSITMAMFFSCVKWSLKDVCYILLWLREHRQKKTKRRHVCTQ